MHTRKHTHTHTRRVCDEQQHWKELTYLYTQYDEWDNAAHTMMAHAPIAWEHVLFKDVSIKVSNVEVRVV